MNHLTPPSAPTSCDVVDASPTSAMRMSCDNPSLSTTRSGPQKEEEVLRSGRSIMSSHGRCEGRAPSTGRRHAALLYARHHLGMRASPYIRPTRMRLAEKRMDGCCRLRGAAELVGGISLCQSNFPLRMGFYIMQLHPLPHFVIRPPPPNNKLSGKRTKMKNVLRTRYNPAQKVFWARRKKNSRIKTTNRKFLCQKKTSSPNCKIAGKNRPRPETRRGCKLRDSLRTYEGHGSHPRTIQSYL